MASRLKATPEQLAYAKLLDWAMKTGILILVLTFIIYISGILSPHIPIDKLPLYWSMPVHEYLKATASPTGWAWLTMLNKADFINFTGIVFLASATIVCYLRIVPILLKNKDNIYALLAVIETVVLCLAASGILSAGGH